MLVLTLCIVEVLTYSYTVNLISLVATAWLKPVKFRMCRLQESSHGSKVEDKVEDKWIMTRNRHEKVAYGNPSV